MIEAVVYKQQPYFNQPQIRIINRAFQSLSFRGYRQTFPVKIVQTRSKSHHNSLTLKPKVYGVVLCTKNPVTNETLYALVQGRYTRKWSFPKGHSTDSETPLECALRELAEETGLKAIPEPTRYIKLVYGYYYLIKVDSQLKLAPTDEHEIMDAKWISLKEMESMDLNADVSEFRKTYADMTE
jgi:ADP-ribose pyrophosphatase YjhB (NUDIX family)